MKLLDHTIDPETVIARAAAICYDSDTSPEANSRRLQTTLEKGHYSVLRFANATFAIEGISRVCSHQIVRTAHAGFLQRSQRYTDASMDKCIYPHSFFNGDDYDFEVRDAVRRTEDSAYEAYALLLKHGVPKEDARYILPQGTTTKLVMTGNFQMWHGWLKARCSKRAQWEIRAVAWEIQNQLNVISPIVFPAIIGFSD